jgi:general secretion pathway protein A
LDAAASEKHVTASSGAQAARPAAARNPARREPPLSDLLAQHAADTDTDSAFGKLFALWGARYVPGGTDPCSQAAQQGLECLTQRGSFGQLRLYNRPAILLLNDDNGNTHQVVLTRLDDEDGRLDLGGAPHDVGIGELSRYWFGDFVMLWRPATSEVKALSPGMRGSGVRWLRQSLQQLQGTRTDVSISDIFDDDLTKLVRDFQRQHRLSVDGIAGLQTQIALAAAVGGTDAPLLCAADTHGG